MFDPFARVVYDYTGGLEDIRRAKVCMYLLSFLFHMWLSIDMLERCAYSYYEILLQVRSIIPAGTSFVDDCGNLYLFLTGFLSFTRIVRESHYIHII